MKQADGTYLFDAVENHTRVWPSDWPRIKAATFNGPYIAWLLLNGHASIALLDCLGARLDKLRNRSTTPGAFYFHDLAGRFDDRMLSKEGIAFTHFYFSGDSRCYLDDYVAAIPGRYPSFVDYPDSWECYDLVATRIAERWSAWRQRGATVHRLIRPGTTGGPSDA
jgi:hypothetical protein